jgi:hypothetical protein
VTADKGRAAQSPCKGETYLSWCLTEDGFLQVIAECNGGLCGDCGYSEDITNEMGVDNDEHAVLVARHMDHRLATKAREAAS